MLFGVIWNLPASFEYYFLHSLHFKHIHFFICHLLLQGAYISATIFIEFFSLFNSRIILQSLQFKEVATNFKTNILNRIFLSSIVPPDSLEIPRKVRTLLLMPKDIFVIYCWIIACFLPGRKICQWKTA